MEGSLQVNTGKRLILPLLALVLLLAADETSTVDNRLKIKNADVFTYSTEDSLVVQRFQGNVVFERGSMHLYTDEASYFKSGDEMHLSGFVRMTDLEDTLNCKNLIYYNASGLLKARDSVVFQQANQIITCDSLNYWTEIDSGRAYSNVTMQQTGRNVTTDSFSYKKTHGYRGTSFSATGNTLVIDGDRIISAHEIRYDDDKQTLDLDKECSLTSLDQGMTGENITIQYADSIFRHVDIEGSGYAYHDLNAKTRPGARTLKNFRDNMSAGKMSAEFENNKLSILKLIKMASTEYHVVQDTVLQGVNSATGDTIVVNFAEAEMERIQVYGGGRGNFVPEGNNSPVKDEIIYQADYLDYHVNEQTTLLQKLASVSYQGMELTAGDIHADWNKNTLTANRWQDILPTITSVGNEPMAGEFMEFNLITKHGRVVKGKTRFNEGNYSGSEVYRDDPDIYHVTDSRYSTCDLEPAHFYFSSNEMKMIPDDRVIAKPLILYIYDLPVFGVPFAVFPNKGGGRHSGWIMPNFGTRPSDGTFFEGLGYYWAPNDYLDWKMRLNFRDKRGIDLNGYLNYKLRYQFNGSLTTTLYRNVTGNEIADLFTQKVDQQYKINWSHTQTIDPTQRLSISANYVSSNTINQDFGWDLSTRLDQRLESRVNYSKTWPGTKNSLSVNLSESYDLLAASKRPDELGRSVDDIYVERTRKVPGISFRHGQSQLFGNGKKSRWYHGIYWSSSSTLNTTQKVGLVAASDSTWQDRRDYDKITGIKHSLSLSSPQTLFGWLTLNPSLRFTEDWVFKYREAQLDSAGYFVTNDGVVEYHEVEKFLPRHTGSVTLSASTKIYGVIPAEVGRLRAIRHVLTPSLSFNWIPDFSKSVLGLNPGYFQEDAAGEKFDYFTGSSAGATPGRESKTIGFGINNEFQVKMQNDDETYDKLNLLTWRLNSSYNATADSLKFAVISSSVRANIPGGLSLDLSMTHDPYKLKLVNISDNPGSENYQYKRVNQFNGFPRLTSLSAGTSFQFTGKRFSSANTAEKDTLAVVEDLDELYTDRLDKPIPKLGNNSLWKANFSVRYSLTNRVSGPEIISDKTFWVNLKLGVNLTKEWSLDYSARIDLDTNEMVDHSFDLYRELHCWEFRFRWWPSGASSGFRLLINVKNPDLKDIKLKSTAGKFSGLW